ncbi:MAG: general secretion pathway protein GspL [Halioglobus sp.]|nr:general secretion pathway protein GspL [Halioglobus sp.]
MAEKAQHWELFGYDIRQLAGYWRGAWRQFLWGVHSPLIARLDEPVRVYGDGAPQYYFAGEPVTHAGGSAAMCEAIVLPDERVLQKVLVLPVAAAADLDAVMALEIAAHNPFPPPDAVSGWAVIGRTDDSVKVGLAVASASAVRRYLARHYAHHDSNTCEIWSRIGSTVVVLQGFGESQRQGRYRQRLSKVALLLTGCALLLMAIAGTYAGTRYLELQQYREMSALVQEQAGAAVRAREALLMASDTATALNDYVSRYPNPQVELARLTALLGDDVSIIRFTMQGRELQLRGRARDAAAVVQALTREPAYPKVSSPQAITKMGNSGFEEFYLDITLPAGDAS